MERCPDDSRCYHGSQCVERMPNEEGSFYCDCSVISGYTVFAGLSCEFAATDYCVSGDLAVSFCTNGVCSQKSVTSTVHLGCNCNVGYTGQVRRSALALVNIIVSISACENQERRESCRVAKGCEFSSLTPTQRRAHLINCSIAN
jgi:hypothetical protein